MDSELSVLCDRLDNLEAEVIELKSQLHKAKVKHFESRSTFGLGLAALTIVLLLGLSIDSQISNTRIVYNNQNWLTELALALFSTGAATWSLRQQQKVVEINDELSETFQGKSY